MVRRGGFGRRGRGVEFDSVGSGWVLSILMSLFYVSLCGLLSVMEGVLDGMTRCVSRFKNLVLRGCP